MSSRSYNQFKDQKKSAKKEPVFNKVGQKLTGWTKNERLKKVTGLFCLLVSAYLLIAFTSFIFTWKADQDKLEAPFWSLIFQPELQLENWLGNIGAIISHLFIHKWFGVASFLFVLLFFLIGFRIVFKISLLPLKKTIKYSLFTLVWLSVGLAHFFYDDLTYLGGSFGYEADLWLTSILGNIGALLFIIFILLTFLIISFNISFNWLKAAFVTFAKSEIKPPETETENQPEAVNSGEDEAETGKENDLPLEMGEGNDEVGHSEEASATDDDEDPAIDLEAKAVEKQEKEPNKQEDGPEFAFEEAKTEDKILSGKEIDNKAKEFGDYDPTLDLGSYKFPPISLLDDHGSNGININREELEANKNKIVETLGNYNIQISKIKATVGPTVTLYEIVPEAGTRISKIKNLEDDIALSLAALGIRIIAPIPGRGTIGIEVPNQNPEIVSMKAMIASDKFQNTDMDLPIAIGKTISNETYLTDLAKMPHLLMAGATGQGKSVGLNTILVSLLYKKHPAQIKFVLVDPKKVELTLFNKIERHFLAKLPDSEEAIITDTKKVVATLNSLCAEMDQRYELLKNAHVRNIKEYNKKYISRKLNPENGHRFLPYIVLVVDEFADLMMTAGKEVESPIARLAQLARAIGIHLIIATQRPSVNIITGTIKANFPSRIAFRVTAKVDSRTILDASGADQLIGRGDMLYSTGSDIKRIQCAFVDTPEVDEICEFIGSQKGYPDAFLLPESQEDTSGNGSDEIDPDDRDSLFVEAAHMVVQHQQGSASLLQRRLKLGYNRAGRIIDQLEAAGIIGPHEGSKARQVLFPDEHSLEQFLSAQGII